MRRLVIKPSQSNHGRFNRLGRTRQSMEDKGMAGKFFNSEENVRLRDLAA
jgi:hypothetical protein